MKSAECDKKDALVKQLIVENFLLPFIFKE